MYTVFTQLFLYISAICENIKKKAVTIALMRLNHQMRISLIAFVIFTDFIFVRY